MTATSETPIALTIAGSEPSGGAGLQADLKTFQACSVYGMSIVTVLTDCTSQGVEQVHTPPADFVARQLNRLADDMPVHAVKSGMLFNRDNVSTVADYLADHKSLPYVFDPVITTRRGERLVDDETQACMIDMLLPHCILITPSMPEAAVLTARRVETRADMQAAAAALIERGASAVLITGGHMQDPQASDCLQLANGDVYWLDGVRRPYALHGAGDCLTAAITAALAQGASLKTAVGFAKNLIDRASARAVQLGPGNRPVAQPALAQMVSAIT